jgi:two-component system CheB/CheR fusion protein
MKTSKPQNKILSDNAFPVVGIGASAGGLDAFKRLIMAIPEESGMAYVLVQHLAPDHASILPALLQKITPIPVVEISDKIEVLPNHIYIIPANKMLVANDGMLQLSPRPARGVKGRYMPIDVFFTSLAEVHQDHAIGVVLSGTATDGTEGLKAIKEHGGLTMAQDEVSAEYDGMPQSAALAGVVDFILTPEEMPLKLASIKGQLMADSDNGSVTPDDEDLFKKILFLIRIRKSTDFTYYKRPTIRRRILRRIAITKSETVSGYLDMLQESKPEQDALYQDLLIPVTSFFRDPQIFEDLCQSVFPHLAKAKSPGDRIRLWIAGCSTGEEAYSMAICLKEYLGDSGYKAQIFATDISAVAITKARAGIYTKSEVAGVNALRLQANFTKTGDTYQVNKQVREMCVFAVHNFLKDPPFGKMDFLSCRNVLIYMEPYLQKKALSTFHYSLNPKGFLLLGRSETSSSVPDLFLSTGTKDKLFIRKDVPSKYMQVTSLRNEQSLHELNSKTAGIRLNNDFQRAADDVLLSHYTPAGVVVNEAMDIVYFRGATDDYLAQAAGKPTHNLLKMARAGLAFELRNVIQKCRKDGKAAVKNYVPMDTTHGQRLVDIEAVSLPGVEEPHYLILFRYSPPAQSGGDRAGAMDKAGSAGRKRIVHLEHELAQTREDMRSITEDQEAANEELQSANEEMLSGSEELQSLNEELETSKEELQSTNEELLVMNQELYSLNEQLQLSNSTQTLAGKRMEAQALMAHELLMTAPGFICTLKGPDHVYELINKRYQKIFGKCNVPGRPIFEAMPELKEQGFDKLLDAVYTTGEPYIGISVPINISCDLAEQKTGYFNFSYQAIYNEDKTVDSILMVGYEITEQVMAKNKLRELQQEHIKQLEEKVTKRTSELSKANETLMQKNKELESFSYVSSHDLQEPLRKIQTFVSQILSKEYAALSNGGKDAFQRISNAASRMQILIQDLLAYSHAAATERRFEKTDLKTVIAEVTKDLDEVIKEKGASIQVGSLCNANINSFQFRQIMQNLISNSLKFSRPDTSALITINSRTASGASILDTEGTEASGLISPDRNYCHISYTDNGIGFEKIYKQKIFEVFERLHSKDQYEGTGIGLAIVKKIVEHHNGIITATGEPGEGAAFDIYIPAEAE